MNKPLRFTAEESTFHTKIITLGAGTNLPVLMSPSELARLIGVIYFDTGHGEALEKSRPDLYALIYPNADYYSLPLSWFLEPIEFPQLQHIALMRLGQEQIPDFNTYLRCLSELHKRRRKYSMILSAQPIPTMVQVSPRALIEYGSMQVEALASWLTWRKFFYDLDNRSAQETGYLFEPILAAAIGGEPKGARTKVVTRTGDNSKGRQVDCWKVLADETKLAYEFKLRVTIAASGQGRFGEEIQFATDCRNSNAVPILVVLDPTSNSRLDELKQAYIEQGGHAYIGEEAWAHLEAEAGDTMAQFIERYVKRPVLEVSQFETEDPVTKERNIELLDFAARLEKNEIVLTFDQIERRIARAERPLPDDEGGDTADSSE